MFEGCNRNNTPEWLLVVMHHSSMFERWHIPIATSITWISNHTGVSPHAILTTTCCPLRCTSISNGLGLQGELAMYPDPTQPGVPHPTTCTFSGDIYVTLSINLPLVLGRLYDIYQFPEQATVQSSSQPTMCGTVWTLLVAVMR